MSFLSLELSRNSGKPVELYHVSAGPRHWYFTTGRRQVVFGGNTYDPVAGKRGRIEQNREFEKSTVSLTLPVWSPMSASLLVNPPENKVEVVIYRFHEGDVDAETAIYWSGRVANVTYTNAEATYRFEPVYTSLRAQGRRKMYSISCGHTLFRQGCRLNEATFAVACIVDSILVDGQVVTASELTGAAPGYYSGGRATATIAGQPYVRQIIGNDDGNFRLQIPFPGLAIGDSVIVYPGCDHTFATCTAKFGNQLNYGGFPWKPLKNPFEGDSPF